MVFLYETLICVRPRSLDTELNASSETRLCHPHISTFPMLEVCGPIEITLPFPQVRVQGMAEGPRDFICVPVRKSTTLYPLGLEAVRRGMGPVTISRLP